MADILADDARVAWRGMVRRPFYAVATIVMLALAIGANATAFGIFYGFLIRPLPYRDAQRLLLAGEYQPTFDPVGASVSASAYGILRKDVPALADSGLWSSGGAAPVRVAHRPQAVRYNRETPSFFRALGIVPLLGRLPRRAAGRPNGPHEMMISAHFWQKDYGSAPSVLGRRLMVNGVDYRIVGVLPHDYSFGGGSDVDLPLVLPATGIRQYNTSNHMVFRLPRGVSRSQAGSMLTDVLPRILRSYPPSLIQFVRGVAMHTRRLRPWFISKTGLSGLPWVLQGTALMLLLLAVANAANLALVRQRARLHEFALRRALGGTGADTMRLLLAEQVPLLIGIIAIAMVLAWLGARLILSYGSAIVSPPFQFGFGWDEVVCVLVLSVLSVIAITTAPAVATARVNLQSAIGQGSKATIGRTARRVQRGLGMVQIALAFALLAGSLTLSVSLQRLLDRPLGFRPDHRIVAQVLAPKTVDMATAMTPVIAALRGDADVVSATGAGFASIPFSHLRSDIPIKRIAPGSPSDVINMSLAGENYFATMGIRVLKGRALETLDQRPDTKVTVIGAGAAKRLFGTTDVVGRMVKIPVLGDFRIVGVATPVVWRTKPWGRFLGTMYVPAPSFLIKAYPIYLADIIVRLRPGVRGADGRIRKSIEAAVPGAVVTSIRSYRRQIARFVGFRRMAAAIVSTFAVLALILAALGVYAVNAFIARARLAEFGMRAMLGASPARLLRLALGEAGWLLVFGLAGGLIGGFLLVRAMSPLLFEAATIAPWMFAVAFVIITAIVLGAAWRPAARAANTPVKILLDSA